MQRLSHARLLFLAMCVCAPGLAWGQTSATTQPAAISLSVLEELNSSSYETREQAMYRLLADDALKPDSILPLYRAATTPEQRVRLSLVAQHHLLRRLWGETLGNRRTTGSNGSIGISHQSVGGADAELGRAGVGVGANNPGAAIPGGAGAGGRGSVRVARTFLGFPGAAYLRRGDVIIGVNGNALGDPAAGAAAGAAAGPNAGLGGGAAGVPGEMIVPPMPRGAGGQPGAGRDVEESFRELVLRSRAGNVIRLTIVRDGRQMDVEFRLAPSEALQMVYDRSLTMNLTPVFRDAWAEFQRKLEEIAPLPVPMTIPWPAAAPVPDAGAGAGAAVPPAGPLPNAGGAAVIEGGLEIQEFGE